MWSFSLLTHKQCRTLKWKRASVCTPVCRYSIKNLPFQAWIVIYYINNVYTVLLINSMLSLLKQCFPLKKEGYFNPNFWLVVYTYIYSLYTVYIHIQCTCIYSVYIYIYFLRTRMVCMLSWTHQSCSSCCAPPLPRGLPVFPGRCSGSYRTTPEAPGLEEWSERRERGQHGKLKSFLPV